MSAFQSPTVSSTKPAKELSLPQNAVMNLQGIFRMVGAPRAWREEVAGHTLTYRFSTRTVCGFVPAGRYCLKTRRLCAVPIRMHDNILTRKVPHCTLFFGCTPKLESQLHNKLLGVEVHGMCIIRTMVVCILAEKIIPHIPSNKGSRHTEEHRHPKVKDPKSEHLIRGHLGVRAVSRWKNVWQNSTHECRSTSENPHTLRIATRRITKKPHAQPQDATLPITHHSTPNPLH